MFFCWVLIYNKFNKIGGVMKDKLFKIVLVVLSVVFVASCSKKMPELPEEKRRMWQII